jgi:hypothetical protein
MIWSSTVAPCPISSNRLLLYPLFERSSVVSEPEPCQAHCSSNRGARSLLASKTALEQVRHFQPISLSLYVKRDLLLTRHTMKQEPI